MTEDQDLAKIDDVEVDELSDEDLEDAAGGSSGILCCSLIGCSNDEEVAV
jgi:hypothetical protein